MTPSLRLSLRLLPVAAAAWGAALTAIHAPAAAPLLAGVLWIAALTAVAVAARRARGTSARTGRLNAAVLVLAVAAAAAAASHVAFAQPEREGVLMRGMVDGRAVAVTAEVIGKVERRDDGTLAFDAHATRVAIGTEVYAVRAPVVVRVDPDDVDDLRVLDVGATIEAAGTVAAARPGERAVLVVRASRGVTVTVAPAGPAQAAGALRQSLVETVAGLPGPGAGLVPGLAVGDTSAVLAELDTAMKESSLSHLTAVSGANCALVVGLAFAATAAVGGARATRVAGGLLALTGFVLLVTPEPSVVRAAAMAAIAMLGVLLGRPGAGAATLSLCVTVLLDADPWLAASVGFALSVTATGSLLLFARPLARGLSRRLPRALALALSVPLAAQLACGPLLVLIDPAVPVYGVLANLLAAPAAPVATVVGLAACLSAPIPLLQDGLAAVAWLPASWISATATTVSGLPADRIPWAQGWPGALALGVVGLAIGVIIGLRPLSRRRVLTRRAAAVLVTVLAGVLGGTGLLATSAGRLTLPDGWSVLACEVGQGDAVLLRSAGAVALVDTGPEPAALASCLDRVGIGRIDLLVLTHFDIDHVGGADAVRGRVTTVLHGPPDDDGSAVLEHLARGGAEVIDARADLSGSLGGARWRVLWPAREGRAYPPGNDASVVLDVRGGGIPPTLLLGDLSASPQRAIVSAHVLDPPYDIVKVAHHGSADQDAALYRAAAPAVALVTVGAENDHGHPRREILDILDEVGARVARTDVEGLLAVWRSSDGLRVWRERDGGVPPPR